MGKPRVTMADVAELAQVSKMSVSRVLNNKSGVSEETRQRILDAAKRLGYESNTNHQSTGSKLIGLLSPYITTAYTGEILRGVSNAAERLNYGLVLFTQGQGTDSQRIDYFASILNTNVVDGVLMIVPRSYDAVASEVKQRQLPYIIIDHHSETGDEPSVTATNRRGTLEAMRHLLALGHQRIGFITGRMDIACSHDRLKGYRDGLVEVGLPFDPELVREGDYLQPSGFQQTQCLLQLEKPPTAILASNDMMAFGVMDAAKQAGLRIGRDISIVGFDDIDIAEHTYPPLTTVRQPLADMGEVALDTLVMLVEGHTVRTLRQELPTELVVRGTTGPAPKVPRD